jgi:hypothetical protein
VIARAAGEVTDPQLDLANARLVLAAVAALVIVTNQLHFHKVAIGLCFVLAILGAVLSVRSVRRTRARLRERRVRS